MSDRKSKRGFPPTSKVHLNQALIDSIASDGEKRLRPGDEVAYDSVIASPTFKSPPWSGNAYKYYIGKKKGDT